MKYLLTAEEAEVRGMEEDIRKEGKSNISE